MTSSCAAIIDGWSRAAFFTGLGFFLASARNPTLPPVLPPQTAYVYIKHAGHAGKKLGLPDPDLIFVNDDGRDRQTEGLRCQRVLALTSKPKKVLSDRFRSFVPFLTLRMMHVSDGERDQIVKAVLGDAFRGVGRMVRPSNGIALVCYAILFGIPKIILSGMSLTDDGHCNPNRKKFQRNHKEEDRASFEFIARHFPSLTTSEPELSSLTGVPLFGGE